MRMAYRCVSHLVRVLPAAYHLVMRVRHASVGIAAALSLAACSSKALPPPAYPLAPPSTPAQTAVQTISEAGGGSVALRDASVVIRPDLLRGNQPVRVTYDPLVRETPPNQGWAIVPGELTVAFTAGTHRPPRLPVRTYTPQTAPSGLLLRMRYPAAYAAAVERAGSARDVHRRSRDAPHRP
jgi:hypothetical protein